MIFNLHIFPKKYQIFDKEHLNTDPRCACLHDPFIPRSDQHLISPNSNTTESFNNTMRIKEMITNLRSSDCYTNFPCQYQRKCKKNSMENMETDVRA